MVIAGHPPDLGFLTAQPFAHRGLHDAAAGIVENSLPAFERAIAAGHGIELDVQLTADRDLVVFHDAVLERLTGARGSVAGMSSARLGQVMLHGTDEPIRTLAAVLMHIGGRAPVLIEAKTVGGNHVHVSAAIRRALEGYRGDVAVMSFDPRVPAWFARQAPRIVRGLVVTDEKRRRKLLGLRMRVEQLASVLRARPHFLAYDIRSLPSPLAARFRRRGGPVLSWTVRTEAEREKAAAYADGIIYEQPVETSNGG